MSVVGSIKAFRDVLAKPIPPQTNGTNTAFTEDHTGLGEYSDEQLIAELKERGINV